MDSARRLPRNLRAGGLVLALLSLLALAAPLLSTELPWLVRGPGGIGSPALARFVGLDPGRSAEPGPRVLVRAPLPHDPAHIDLDVVLQPPTREHWLGTDGLGRDLAARILHGTRVSLGVGLLAAAFALLVGVPLGALAGYRGGLADASVSRCIECVLCFPTVLLALAILATAPGWLRGLPDATKIALVLGVTGWVPVARFLRGEFLRLRTSEIVESAHAAGAGHLRTVVFHILPSALAPVLVTAAFAVAAAVTLEAALSFLGLGVRPPTPSWGGLLKEARTHVDHAWWLALFPGAALFTAVLGCNLLGEGIRDFLDPRAHR